MLGARNATQDNQPTNATVADFCRIFGKDMDRLHLLSLLLTADSQLAEECFVRGLEDALKSNRVFKEWAHAWARRMIIQSAIQMVQPTNQKRQVLVPIKSESMVRQLQRQSRRSPRCRHLSVSYLSSRCSNATPIRTARCSWAALPPGDRSSLSCAATHCSIGGLAAAARPASDEPARRPKRRLEIRYIPLLQLAASV